jgi:NAD(P)-dependent dehydrogenase (short-subunit alcohol dehydrogenase family)
MQPLKHKRLVITGAASGIGKATSLLAAAEGASVVAVDLAAGVNDTVREITAAGGRAVAVQADVSDEAAVAAFVARCVDEFGGIDGLYANAGIGGCGKPFAEMSAADWHAVPHLVRQGAGAILCTASVAGLRANAGGVDYSASKAAVISIVQTMAYQLYGTGVRINAICPGLIETGMTRPAFERARERGTEDRIGQINPTRRAGQPIEIAQMACFLLSDRASYVNGQAIPVDGGLSASLPWVFPRGAGNGA